MASAPAVPAEQNSTREQLLHAASALMIENQVADFSLSELAKKSGLSSGLVKYYFGNKQGMFLAILDHVLGASLRQMEWLVSSDLDPVSKLKIHVKAIINIYFRYPYINRLIHYLFQDQAAGQIVAETINIPLARTQRALVAQGIESGVLKAIDPMQFYFIVLGACDHLFFGQQILRVAFGIETIDDDLRRSYTDTLLDILINGMLVPKPA